MLLNYTEELNLAENPDTSVSDLRNLAKKPFYYISNMLLQNPASNDTVFKQLYKTYQVNKDINFVTKIVCSGRLSEKLVLRILDENMDSELLCSKVYQKFSHVPAIEQKISEAIDGNVNLLFLVTDKSLRQSSVNFLEKIYVTVNKDKISVMKTLKPKVLKALKSRDKYENWPTEWIEACLINR